ncbi:MAG: dihydroorotate dehydrogenase (quinone) [Chitinophagales bacterium]|nr:MAG: dihydroorotate dehydrogenase (quinone) [Chitinophagales bacterium]
MYKLFFRPLLFLLPPETAHSLTLWLLKAFLKVPLAKSLLHALYSVSNRSLERSLFGLTFPNYVGLAAGFDKNARYIDELACFGFGFIEVGTITPLPQPGNSKPRVFRLPQDRALINRMGFNNDGAHVIAQRLKKRKSKIIIGANIGKNKHTPNEKAAEDYVKCFDILNDYVDYFTINVSSPNTPGLRDLQSKEPLQQILRAVQARNKLLPRKKPVLLKIAPDLTHSQLDDIITICQEEGIDGIIATNTTQMRPHLKTDTARIQCIGEGGLSGEPLRELATRVIDYLRSHSKLPVIGTGGIMSKADADKKLQAGALLLQVYTGFIYEGPSLVKKILQKGNQNR